MDELVLTWDSNPYVYGAIHLRINGRKAALGGISNVRGEVKGYFTSELLYTGDSEKEAMAAVEQHVKSLPISVIHGLRD